MASEREANDATSAHQDLDDAPQTTPQPLPHHLTTPPPHHLTTPPPHHSPLTTPSFRFRPAEHLRRPSDFRRVYERRRSLSNSWLIIYACENGLSHLRIGLSVSRKYGQATRRARLRRLYREAFRLTRYELPTGLDLVLIPRGSEEPPLEELKHSLASLVQQLARRLAREAGPK